VEWFLTVETVRLITNLFCKHMCEIIAPGYVDSHPGVKFCAGHELF
jgi:hypothetical protein